MEDNEEVVVDVRHVFAAIIERQGRNDAARKIARHFEQEMVAHARHAAAHACGECRELVARHDELMSYARPGEPMTDTESTELDESLNEMTSHMSLEADLEGPR